MKNTNLISLVRKTLSGIILLGVLFSAFGAGGLAIASAQGTDAPQPAGTLTAGHILSDGQFVFGPNVGDFDLKNYLASNAPHLLKYADDITGRAEYYSINPKILLTLLEMQAQIISKPNTAHIEDPFGLNTGGFIAQIETLSSKMADAYYLHLYSYSPLLVSQRILPAFAMRDGQTVDVAPDTNAGSYAIMAGLAAIGWHDFSLALDNSQAQGFYQTYTRLFGNDDPLDERNRIAIPGTVSALVAPENLLQLPFLRGLSWKFGGVHNNSAGSTGSPLTDASAMDFYPSGSTWNIDTSSMWVVAAAAGVPTKISACYFKIVHSDGWETTYYHLENVQTYAGSINQNDKIGVIANTLPEAICSGGASSGPHVHFTLKHNGALVAINGTALAGWVVHSGRWCYDTDPNYMWLVRSGQKKYAFSDTVLSEGVSNPPQISSISRDATDLVNVKFIVTFTSAVTGVDAGDFSLTTSGLTGAVVSGLIGSGSSYTVTVNPGSGTGTLRLDAVDNDSILDLAGVPLGGVGTGNGNFSSGETVIINRTPGTFIISGNAGVGGATLSYTDGVPKSAVANASGLYFLALPSGWSGTVTVGKPGSVFLPVNRSYTVLAADQANQNYKLALRGADTTGVFRPSNGALYLKNTNTTGFADVAINYGLAGDYPVTGDWDGNGTKTIGIYRNGFFYLRNTNSLGNADLVLAFGAPGDQPIAGDWNGDGIDTIGVYRSLTGTFYLRNSNTYGAPEISFSLGVPGDVGIAGDWNGDGLDTTGVFRPSNGALYLKNSNSTGFADVAINYGLPGDRPVTGDWDNNGTDTIGIYRNGTFYLRNSNSIGFADLQFALGNSGDMPISGNWDGLP